jgi:hypothetical protein
VSESDCELLGSKARVPSFNLECTFKLTDNFDLPCRFDFAWTSVDIDLGPSELEGELEGETEPESADPVVKQRVGEPRSAMEQRSDLDLDHNPAPAPEV